MYAVVHEMFNISYIYVNLANLGMIQNMKVSFWYVLFCDSVCDDTYMYKNRSYSGCYLWQVLHGEQYTEIYKPLPPRATLTSKSRVVDILDKGSGAVLIVNGNADREAFIVCTKST